MERDIVTKVSGKGEKQLVCDGCLCIKRIKLRRKIVDRRAGCQGCEQFAFLFLLLCVKCAPEQNVRKDLPFISIKDILNIRCAYAELSVSGDGFKAGNVLFIEDSVSVFCRLRRDEPLCDVVVYGLSREARAL